MCYAQALWSVHREDYVNDLLFFSLTFGSFLFAFFWFIALHDLALRAQTCLLLQRRAHGLSYFTRKKILAFSAAFLIAAATISANVLYIVAGHYFTAALGTIAVATPEKYGYAKHHCNGNGYKQRTRFHTGHSLFIIASAVIIYTSAAIPQSSTY